jgi:hypothetical protein
MQFLAVLEACVDDLDMASLFQTAQPDDIARQFYDLDRPEDQYGSDVCRDRGIIARGRLIMSAPTASLGMFGKAPPVIAHPPSAPGFTRTDLTSHPRPLSQTKEGPRPSYQT